MRRTGSLGTDIDQVGLVSGMQVVNHRGFVQMGQLRHVVCLVELGRIDFVNLVGIHFPLLYIMSVLPKTHAV